MARVVFTSHLRQHIDAPIAAVAGGTVREVLGAVFAGNPRLGGYILDDQGELRRHVVVFVDGERSGLNDPVNEASEIYVMQALSGG
jgi:molybdopterin synthase sulfur carrier subunit